jgi:di/tricarboxylate transporter
MLGIIIMWAILLAIAELGGGLIKTAVGELETNSPTKAKNMLVMEPGGYAFDDYVKIGLPLLLLTLLVTVALSW